MSRKDEGGGSPQTETPAIRAVEEHAAAMGIAAPVFTAVKQANGWAAGKKVEKAVFEKAVNAFLKAPIGGV